MQKKKIRNYLTSTVYPRLSEPWLSELHNLKPTITINKYFYICSSILKYLLNI